MRLFAVREYKRGPLVKDWSGTPVYFGNKQDAKRYRDVLPEGAVVTLGPDHKLFKGD